MYKLLMYGTGSSCKKFLKELNCRTNNILAFVESDPIPGKMFAIEVMGHEMECIIIKPDEIKNYEYDYIIVASTFAKEIKETLLKYKIDERKIIFWQWVKDYHAINVNDCNQYEKLKTMLYLLKEDSHYSQYIWYLISKKYMQYQVCLVENLYFMFNSLDNVISTNMVVNRQVYSKKDMDFFMDNTFVSHKNKGYFIDIGANIGTTSIYMKKKKCESLQYIAFEPLNENYKMLQNNIILNDCVDIRTEKLALSNKNAPVCMIATPENFGASYISDGLNHNALSELVESVRLDDYLKQHNIEFSEISYIWLDVEGHEVCVLEGMQETLHNNPIPLYMEYNPQAYILNKQFDLLLDILGSVYSHFVFDAGNKTYIKTPINGLRKMTNNKKNSTMNILLISCKN